MLTYYCLNWSMSQMTSQYCPCQNIQLILDSEWEERTQIITFNDHANQYRKLYCFQISTVSKAQIIQSNTVKKIFCCLQLRLAYHCFPKKIIKLIPHLYITENLKHYLDHKFDKRKCSHECNVNCYIAYLQSYNKMFTHSSVK